MKFKGLKILNLNCQENHINCSKTNCIENLNFFAISISCNEDGIQCGIKDFHCWLFDSPEQFLFTITDFPFDAESTILS